MSQMQPIRLLTPSFCAGMSNSLAQTLTISNYVFTGLFACEMVLKLFALGFIEYIADRFNCFDGVVVILSIIEIILDVSFPTLVFSSVSLLPYQQYCLHALQRWSAECFSVMLTFPVS